jgi:hypothetical protein
MAYSYNVSELRQFLQSHTNVEAAIHYGVNVRTIARWRKADDLSNEQVKCGHFPVFSPEQSQIIDACMLGDGGIEKSGSKRFRFGQCLQRKEYVDWMQSFLSPYVREPYMDANSWRFCSVPHSSFRNLRDKWYRNNKIVPRDLVLTPLVLAHWFVQDGSNRHSRRAAVISTNSFHLDDVEFLVSLLDRNFGIVASINFQNKQPVIYIGSYEHAKFVDLIKPFVIWDCFQYKVDMSLVKSKKNVNLGAGKLNREKAKEIRSLHSRNIKVEELAKIYNVTVNTVYNILNNLTYKEPNLGSGTAEVSVIYNVTSVGSVISNDGLPS